MMKNKTFTTFEIINIVAYFNQHMTDEQKKEMPTKMKWYLKKNLDKLTPLSKNFEEFRDSEIAALQNEYFNEEKSDEYMETQKDENGNVIKDENGNETTIPMRKVKEEYMNEYRNTVDELNNKLQEILAEKNVVEIATVDMDAFVEKLPDDSNIDFDCLNILSFMDETTNVEEAK